MTLDSIGILARASLLLTLSGIGVWCLSRWKPLGNPIWHRLAWGAVLAQGFMLFPMSLQVTLPDWWAARVSKPPIAVVVESGIAPSAAEGSAVGPIPAWSEPAPIIPHEPVAPSTLFAEGTPSREHSENNGRSSAAALPHPTVPASRWTISQIPIRAWLVSVWGAGVLVVLGALGKNYWHLHIALTACHPARKRWATEMQSLCQELQLDHEVRLDIHPKLGPFLCWTPSGTRVVVPVRLWNRLTRDERIAVLHHELCHLRRGDLWKGLLARIVVALHWFNPVAWASARRFDESAEWACDSRMASESPSRTTLLANALLTASQAGQDSPYLALSATGGPLFQRVRRLVSPEVSGDTIVKKAVWFGLLVTVVGVGAFRLEWQLPTLAAQETEQPESRSEAPATEKETDEKPESTAPEPQGTEVEPAPAAALSPESNPHTEYADRIVVGENDSLKRFVELTQTPTGQIVMADRAALAAQEASNNADPASQWQQFVGKTFQRADNSWAANADSAEALSQYVARVKTGQAELGQIAKVFQEVANEIVEKPEITPVLIRFLKHEAAPAFVYHTELQSRLHPGMAQLEERFQEHLVRTRTGSYVIRPTRRAQVEKRLKFIEMLQGPLGRFEKELAAWAEEIVKGDDTHDRFAATLRMPEFARYVVFDHISEDSNLSDEELDGMFSTLEEATLDTAAGLKLNPDSDEYKGIQERMDRFHLVWDNRDSLSGPLKELAERIEPSDELHGRLQAFLGTDLALLFVARDMDYLPVDPDQAAREWLSQIITKNDSGKYEITVESTEDLSNRLEEFFREFRDIRRRGRVVDEFAGQLTDLELKVAMESLIGKLLLTRLVEAAQEQPEVDGLKLWFDNHFQETPEGLVLNDWAGEVVTQILTEAEEIEKELAKQDF